MNMNPEAIQLYLYPSQIPSFHVTVKYICFASVNKRGVDIPIFLSCHLAEIVQNCELVFILFLSLLVFVYYLIVMELAFILSLTVFFCYLIVIELYHFQYVDVLFHCDGTRLQFITSSMLSCYFILMVCSKQEN